MNPIKLPEFDLNLLRVFNALMDERSVTKAAFRLGVTPSAVSHSLKSLRDLLGDTLFTRGPNGMQPTELATDLGPRVQAALAQVRSALRPNAFEPLKSERRFAISMTPYTCWLLLPQLMPRFRAEAPHATITIEPSGGDVLEDLDTGRIDLAVGVFDQAPQRFEVARLLVDRMVFAIRAGHRLAQEPLTLDALAETPHVILSTQGSGDRDGVVRRGGLVRRVVLDDGGTLDAALAARRQSRIIALTVPDALSALAVVASSDFLTLSPRRLALALTGAYGLKLFEQPYKCPEIRFDLLCRRDPEPGPAITWLRRLIRDVASTL